MKKKNFLARSALPRPHQGNTGGEKTEIDRAIVLLQGRIALLEREFADRPESMEYRAALRLAVQALKREREAG